jgi:hypothetical protein
MSPRKTNAAAMRREREQLLNARNAEPTPFPDGFVTWLSEEYRPTADLGVPWPALKPFVQESLFRSAIRGIESLRKTTTHITHFGAWAYMKGLSLQVGPTVRRVNTDEYCRVGMPDSSEKSRSDRRSRLRGIADHIHPEDAPQPGKAYHRPSIKPPYNHKTEMPAIRRAIKTQPTEELVRQLCLCVGLGAGAGIDSPDLKSLTANHVDDRGENGILVSVPGDRARAVWVLREYEWFVRRGLQGVAAGRLLLGQDPDRANVASRVYERAVLLGSVPKIEQSRLRTTWLATLMTRPVPLAVLCQAAGLKSTRTLFDLLPHIELTSDSNATAGSTR